MSKYKAIISDVDGTIIPIDINASPSLRVVKTIKKLKSRNIHFSLATGRPFNLVENIIETLDLTAPIITDNGAVIASTAGEILWEAILPHDEAAAILKSASKYGFTRISTNQSNPDNPKRIPNNEKVRKISVHDLWPKEADHLIAKIEAKHKDIAIAKGASFKGEEYIDVYFSHAHATKQRAVLEYSQLLKIDTKDIIGIGDGTNDFPLLMACGLKVAMGNAVDDLKAIADFIAPSVDQDGLAVMIEKFVL